MDYINNTDSLNIHFILWIQSIQILKENFRSKVTQYYAITVIIFCLLMLGCWLFILKTIRILINGYTVNKEKGHLLLSNFVFFIILKTRWEF